MKENEMTIGNLFLQLDGDTIVCIQIGGTTVYLGEKCNMVNRYLKLHVKRWYVTSYTVVVTTKEDDL